MQTIFDKLHNLTVVFSTDNLWSHPVRRSHHCGPLFITLNVCAEAEVCDLDTAVGAQEDVVRLDVSMKDSTLVKVVHAFKNLKLIIGMLMRLSIERPES